MKSQNHDKQSRSGWGGSRPGAGAPRGNINAVKHGERSSRAFFPIPIEDEHLTPLAAMRVRNLMMAPRCGELMRENPTVGTAAWREYMLIGGVMWQHTRKAMIMMKKEARGALDEAREGHKLAKVACRNAQAGSSTPRTAQIDDGQHSIPFLLGKVLPQTGGKMDLNLTKQDPALKRSSTRRKLSAWKRPSRGLGMRQNAAQAVAFWRGARFTR